MCKVDPLSPCGQFLVTLGQAKKENRYGHAITHSPASSSG
jgi:hypothetical protein